MRATEKLFEEVTLKLKHSCDESLMPFESEELDLIYTETLDFANRTIALKLSDIASVESLVELRAEFEKRVRSYFKSSILSVNDEQSRTQCLNLLSTLMSTHMPELKVAEVADIQPQMMTVYKHQFAQVLQEYAQKGKGPYRAEAVAEIFQAKVLEDMAGVIKDIESAY